MKCKNFVAFLIEKVLILKDTSAMKVCSFLPAATKMIYDMGLQEMLYGITFECPKEALAEKQKVVRYVLEGNTYTSIEIDKIFSASKAQGKSMYYVDDAILQRWQIESGKQYGVNGMEGFGSFVIAQKTAVDDVFDTHYIIGSNNVGTGGFLDLAIGQTLSPVYKAFSAANNGQASTDISQLLPYATTPEQQAALQKMILRASANK